MAEAEAHTSGKRDSRELSPPRWVKSRFNSLEEWDEWVNANCAPRRADDTPVLMGQTGPRKRATPEELIAFVNEQRARYGWPPYDPSNPSA
jgi:hypothetical protein